MGQGLFFNWFGKTVTELKAIKEKDWEKLSEIEREQLDSLIAEKEKQENE